MSDKRLVIVEGVDGAGKSTFIAENFPEAHIIHRGPIPEGRTVANEYVDDVRAALEEHDFVVMDRWWPSHIVYSVAFERDQKTTRQDLNALLSFGNWLRNNVTVDRIVLTANYETIKARLVDSPDTIDQRIVADEDFFNIIISEYIKHCPEGMWEWINTSND